MSASVHIEAFVGNVSHKEAILELHYFLSEMINSIENTIAIAFFGSIAIAIAKAIFKLLLLLLLLVRRFFNYCYCYCYW